MLTLLKANLSISSFPLLDRLNANNTRHDKVMVQQKECIYELQNTNKQRKQLIKK